MKILDKLKDDFEKGCDIRNHLTDWRQSADDTHSLVANSLARHSNDLNPTRIEAGLEKYRLKIQSKLKVLEKLTDYTSKGNDY